MVKLCMENVTEGKDEVIKLLEFTLIPERGTRLGEFNAAGLYTELLARDLVYEEFAEEIDIMYRYLLQ